MVIGPVLTTEMSALGRVGVMVTDAWLLSGLGSRVVDVTAEMFVNAVAVLGAVTTSVKVCDAPAASVAIVGHVTTFPVNVPPFDALTNVVPAGSVSFTTTFAAADGPLFVTLTVYVTLVPVITTLSGPSLAMATSATGSTVVVNVVRLFPGIVSGVAALTAETLITAPPAAGGVTTSPKTSFAPTASAGIAGHVTTLPSTVPPRVALTNVTPAGSVSVSTTFSAIAGPAFDTMS